VVILHTQKALLERGAFRLEVDTDLLRDSISAKVWEPGPHRLKVQVLSVDDPQLWGLSSTTDGDQSIAYSPHAKQVRMGPAEIVTMPSLIERSGRCQEGMDTNHGSTEGATDRQGT